MRPSALTSDDAFKHFTKRLGHVVRAHGFRGTGANYRRERGEQWQAINIQKSQWRVERADPICFYVNIGIDYPRLSFKRWLPLAASLDKFIANKAETAFRIDDLLPQERFDWFSCQGINGHNVDGFCTRFEQVMTQHLLPLLDDMATPTGMARVLRMVPWHVSAGAREFLGRALTPPAWDPADERTGEWERDSRGLWWKQGERRVDL